MTATAPRSALGLTIDTLHEAAREMRERASVATVGPWEHIYGGIFVGAETEDLGISYECQVVDEDDLNFAEDDAAHIASWHPAVALAVADLLDRTARILPVGDNGGPAVLPGSTYEAAVAVATAYLGVSA